MPSGKPVDGSSNSAIDEAALACVQQVAARGAPEDHLALARFRAESEEHAAAAARAEQLQQLTEALPETPVSPARRIARNLDLWWTRLTERPALPVTGAVALVACAWFLSAELRAPSPVVTSTVAARPVPQASPLRLRTRWGQRQTAELPDGSQVWMDWETELTASFDDASRRVTLAGGNAIFDVVSRDDHPFIVLAGSSETRVMGTQFIVSRSKPDLVEVSVLEGAVEVGTVDEPRQRLTPGQRIVAEGSSLGPISQRPVEELGRWREGMLVFDERPLVDALETIAGYSRLELDTSQMIDLGERVTGVFFTDRADDALQTLVQAHRLEQKLDRGLLVIRSPRPLRPERP
ncbi:MAG: FecR domain-containing protein [Pseudomonadota bacterium]